jgi:hypothetical protein
MNMDDLRSRHYRGYHCNWQLINNNLSHLMMVLLFVLVMETSPLGVLKGFSDLGTKGVKLYGHCRCESGCGVRCSVEESRKVLELRSRILLQCLE